MTAEVFCRWIERLEDDVIQGDYGYEPGEFTVYPEHWRAMYERGLTPEQAFRRALDMFACARVADECEQAINWARICHEESRRPSPGAAP